jgi:hypothetical protein
MRNEQKTLNMKRNVIILTSGLTGSSVLTALISRAGFWTGETHKKEDYDTYENRRLIELNLNLFREAGFTGNYLTEFSAETMDRIGSLYGRIEDRPYREFLDECNTHASFVWKDPRLWLTIRFWKNLLNLEECNFVVLTRGYLQCWTSATLRRQIRSYRDSRMYEQRVKDSALDFLKENRLSYLQIGYEELIVSPEGAVDRLNGFLGCDLTVEDLKTVYSKPLYKAPRSSWFDVGKAGLIYLKNYSQRVDAVTGRK